MLTVAALPGRKINCSLRGTKTMRLTPCLCQTLLVQEERKLASSKKNRTPPRATGLFPRAQSQLCEATFPACVAEAHEIPRPCPQTGHRGSGCACARPGSPRGTRHQWRGADQLWAWLLCYKKPKESPWRPPGPPHTIPHSEKGPQSRCGSWHVPTDTCAQAQGTLTHPAHLPWLGRRGQQS